MFVWSTFLFSTAHICEALTKGRKSFTMEIVKYLTAIFYYDILEFNN